MYRTITISLIMIIVFGYSVFSIKREVEAQSLSLRSLNKQLQHEKSTINLLKAELTHLTHPPRLRQLVNSHLKLASLTPERLIHDPVVAIHQPTKTEVEVKQFANNKRNNKQWRYKGKYNKNVTQASLHSSVR